VGNNLNLYIKNITKPPILDGFLFCGIMKLAAQLISYTVAVMFLNN